MPETPGHKRTIAQIMLGRTLPIARRSGATSKVLPSDTGTVMFLAIDGQLARLRQSDGTVTGRRSSAIRLYPAHHERAF